MAFCNKLAGLLRQSVSQTNGISGNMTSVQNLRWMSSARLFVGGLSWGTDDQSLRDAFSSFGDVTEAKVITDRDTGKSRGFGFVHFADNESATSAVSAMDGQELNGRSIRVSYATERPSGPRFGGGGGSFGGSRGFGGNSGYGGSSEANEAF